MFWWIAGGGEPLAGPFCVHAAAVASPIAAGLLFVNGPVEPPDDGGDTVVRFTVVGQVYAPGLTVAAAAQASAVGRIDASSLGAAQLACEDDL